MSKRRQVFIALCACALMPLLQGATPPRGEIIGDDVYVNCEYRVAAQFPVEPKVRDLTFRVGNRTGLARGKTPREVEDKLVRVTPDRYRRHAHHWLILHGRYVCKARSPDCPNCTVRELCAFKGKVTLP